MFNLLKVENKNQQDDKNEKKVKMIKMRKQ